MKMAKEEHRCPFLREDKVAFCRAFPLKKPLPFDRIYARENLCLKGEYLRCPIYREKEGEKERTPKRICPFLEIETVMYCDLFPIKKMIPSSCYKLECPCTSERYTECPLFVGIARGDLSTPSGMEEVEGFSLGPYVYSEGHFWLQEEGDRVRMGLDDFGQFLIGPIKGISLPSRGQRLRKGHPFVTLICRSAELQLPAPLSGQIVQVNEEVERDPSLINFDPYGRGWLLQLQPEGWPRQQRGFLHGEEAKRWLAEEVQKLRYLLQGEVGVTMADGGELLRDRLQEVSRQRWDLLVETFLKKGGMKDVGSH